MSVIRVEHNKNYTIIDNYPLRDMNLSLKAKGLLTYMLSLPDDWDYSVIGLTKVLKEGKDSIRAALIELEENGYMERVQLRSNDGTFSTDTEYIVRELPINIYPKSGNPTSGLPIAERTPQTNIINTNNENNKVKTKQKNENDETKKFFTKPTVDEVRAYCEERNNNVDPETFVDFYESKGWMVGKNKMKNWKATVRTWEKNAKNHKKEEPAFYDYSDKGWGY